jgi:hypothetical protein
MRRRDSLTFLSGAAAAGWLAAVGIALIAGALFGIHKLPVLLASGALWTCLLLLE